MSCIAENSSRILIDVARKARIERYAERSVWAVEGDEEQEQNVELFLHFDWKILVEGLKRVAQWAFWSFSTFEAPNIQQLDTSKFLTEFRLDVLR